MRKHIRTSAGLLLLLGGLAACGDDPVSPDGDTPFENELALSQDIESQVVGDEDVADVAVVDVAYSMDASPDAVSGPPGEARDKFRQAREAISVGDTTLARELAREARTILAQWLIDTRGSEAVDHLFGRVENLVERIDEAGDEFERLGELKVRVTSLYDEALAFREAGDDVAAAERLILALQMADRMRHRHRDFILDPAQHARLAVARAGHAIQLADRILGDEASPMQARILDRAGGLFRRAELALSQGRFRAAVVLGGRAEWLCLFAVLEGQRPTVQDALALLELAETLIGEAAEAIGDDPTPAQEAILKRAIHLKNAGARAVNNFHWRGVGLLWHSAVTAAILI